MAHSPETRAKISAALKGKPRSEAHKAALRAVPHTWGAKISAARKGKPVSLNSLENLLVYASSPRSAETRHKISQARLNSPGREARLLRAKQAKLWRSVLWAFLRRKGERKQAPVQQLLGYTYQEFVSHIESLFITGMSWDNHGQQWELDHARPINTFPAGTPANVVNALSNLRPLWAHEHRRRPFDGSDVLGWDQS